MSVEQKIAKAKTRLVVRHPYFGMLASRLECEAADLEAFLSDGRVLQYNERYFAQEPIDTIEFALANSVMHHILSHENRRLSRQGWLWQLATDYAINAMLKENGFLIPERANYEERFAGMYAEEIYAQLKDEIQNEDYNDDESNEEGFNEQNKNRLKEQEPQKGSDKKNEPLPLPPAELAPEIEQEWARAMEEALKKAQEQGEKPGGIERLFRILQRQSVDWRSELYSAINRHLKSDYTFARPNKKAICGGIYLPSTCSERLDIVVAIDSSGSVDEDLLGRFVAELEALLLSFPDTAVDLLICDARIQGVYRFLTGETLEFSLKGGGGTDFRPVFDYIEREGLQPSLLIYFTDAKGTFPASEPPYETIWVLNEAREVPFGRIIFLQRQSGAD